MGLRYGLLAVLTLIIASALVWDRLHPPETNRLLNRDEPAKEDLAVVVLGGRPEPLRAPPPPAASMPGGSAAGVLAADEPAAPAPGSAMDGNYTVEKGDTLGQIALKTLGTSRKAGELAKFNGLDLDSPLQVGQELRIPPAVAAGPASGSGPAPSPAQAKAPAAPSTAKAALPSPAKETGRTHTVGKGDTLISLARRFYGDGGRFRALAEANGLDPDEPLKVGTELKVP